jgi:hypothetical protein
MGMNERCPFPRFESRRAVGGIQEVAECFKMRDQKISNIFRSFVERVHLMSIQRQVVNQPALKTKVLGCRSVAAKFARNLANYMKDDISPERRKRIERHFLKCDGCFAIYVGLRKVVRLVISTEIIELPPGFSARL